MAQKGCLHKRGCKRHVTGSPRSAESPLERLQRCIPSWWVSPPPPPGGPCDPPFFPCDSVFRDFVRLALYTLRCLHSFDVCPLPPPIVWDVCLGPRLIILPLPPYLSRPLSPHRPPQPSPPASAPSITIDVVVYFPNAAMLHAHTIFFFPLGIRSCKLSSHRSPAPMTRLDTAGIEFAGGKGLKGSCNGFFAHPNLLFNHFTSSTGQNVFLGSGRWVSMRIRFQAVAHSSDLRPRFCNISVALDCFQSDISRPIGCMFSPGAQEEHHGKVPSRARKRRPAWLG